VIESCWPAEGEDEPVDGRYGWVDDDPAAALEAELGDDMMLRITVHTVRVLPSQRRELSHRGARQHQVLTSRIP
jgi:hypothetical protein